MKALVIQNPIAGSVWRSLRFHEIEKVLKSASIPFVLEKTCQSGDATRFARQARQEGFSHVLVFGGDGTFREAAQALAGSDVILVPIPSGTANLLAHELGLRTDLKTLPELLKKGRVKQIDLGKADGLFLKGAESPHYFILMAGIGMDAVAVRGVDSRLKRWMGWILYIVSGFWNVARHRSFRTTLHFIDPPLDPVTLDAWVIVVGNARAYGIRGIRVASHAEIDDGLLDICVFQSRNMWHFIKHFFMVLAGKHLEDEDVLYFKAKSLRIETETKTPVQLDGDLFGETPITLSVDSRCLNILVPPEAGESTQLDLSLKQSFRNSVEIT